MKKVPKLERRRRRRGVHPAHGMAASRCGCRRAPAVRRARRRRTTQRKSRGAAQSCAGQSIAPSPALRRVGRGSPPAVQPSKPAPPVKEAPLSDAHIILHNTRFPCQEARCVCRQAACEGRQAFTPQMHYPYLHQCTTCDSDVESMWFTCCAAGVSSTRSFLCERAEGMPSDVGAGGGWKARTDGTGGWWQLLMEHTWPQSCIPA